MTLATEDFTACAAASGYRLPIRMMAVSMTRGQACRGKNFGANMLSKWATDHTTNHYKVEPALEESREMMFAGKLTIAGHNHELLKELRGYHRDDNFYCPTRHRDSVGPEIILVVCCSISRSRLPFTGFGAHRSDRVSEKALASSDAPCATNLLC